MITKVSCGEAVNNGKNRYNVLAVNSKNNFTAAVENGMPEGIKKKKNFGDIFIKNAINRAPLLLLMTGGFTAVDNFIRKVPVKEAVKNNLKWVFTPVLLITSLASAIIENKQINKDSNKK